MARPTKTTTTTTKTTRRTTRTSGARNTFDAIVRGAERAINAAIPKNNGWYTKTGSNLARKAGKEAAKAVRKATKRRKAPTYRGYISRR